MRRRLPHLLIFAAVAVIYLTGGLNFIEFKLVDARMRLLQRDASGGLVVVAIDLPSLRELDTWPWSRAYHAEVLERLIAAGATSVAFNIDFSSRSTPEADSRFVKALGEAGDRVVMPIFMQFSATADGTNSLFLTTPLGEFRQHTRIAAVNIRPERDGLIRRMALSETWGNEVVPTLPVSLATANSPPGGPFYIDFGIRLASIPRLSYVDVLRGRFDPTIVADKHVLIGTTAAQLGDQVPVPLLRSTSGSMLQALAYESLVQNRALRRLESAAILSLALLLAVFLGPRFATWSWRLGLVVVMVASVGFVSLAFAIQSALPVTLDTTPWLLVVIASYGLNVIRQIDRRDLRIFMEGMSKIHRRAILQGVVDNSHDAILFVQRDGLITEVNGASERIFGYQRAEVIGQTVDLLVPHPRFDELDQSGNGDDGDGGALVPAYGPAEVTGRRRDGSIVPIELVVTKAFLRTSRRSFERRRAGRIVFVWTIRDVTERQAIEEQLRHAQKMEAVGQLTGGLAHDFNNLLAVIMGNLELLDERLEGDSELRDLARRATMASRRGADLTQHLLAFSRKQTLLPRATDLNVLVMDTLDLLRRSIGEMIEIETILDGALWQTFIDASQLDNAILNLAINARDAMPNGGKLVIETANAYLDGDRVNTDGDAGADPFVMLAVSDNGVGMASEVVAKAVEPFFTTKDASEGSGLGLSMVFGFVKQSGGHLRIDSEIDKGTTVRLYLPRSRGSPEAPAATAIGSMREGKGETILVVEDERDVRELAARILATMGYRPLEAKDGKSALAVLDQVPEVAVLFSDVFLPGGMSGPDLAREARRRRPDLKVLFTSGYAENELNIRSQLGDGAELIEKPYQKGNLARKLNDILGDGDR